MPEHHKVREHPHLNRIFGALLHDPNLLHLNRRSVSGAFAVGLFWACIPMPLQMLPSAACAIAFRTNLPIAVGLVWLTNPITMPPLFYFCYKLGAWLLDRPVRHIEFEFTLEWFMREVGMIWEPLYLGSVICGLVAAALGYGLMRGLWRLHIVNHIKRRRSRVRSQI